MLSYQFSNLLGIVHNTGRVLFLKDDTNILLSPLGNKILCLDLKYGTSQTLPIEIHSNIDFIDITSDSKILIVVDILGYCLVINFPKQIVISHFNFRSKISALKISPNNKFLAVGINKAIEIFEMPNLIKEYEPFVLYRKYTSFHNDKITSINWSYDSRFILTGSKDTNVRILNLFKIPGYYPYTFTGHKKKIITAVFSKDMERIFSLSQDGVLLIWKYIDEQSDEFKKHINFVKNIKPKKNYKYDKINKKNNINEKNEEEENNDDNNINDNVLGINSDEENESEISNEEEKNIDTKYFTEFEKKILKGRYILEKKEQFVINSKVVMCEITQNLTSESSSEDNNILVLGLQNGSFSIYSMNNFENKYSLKISDSKISSLSINPSGKWIAFGSKYLNQLLVWEWKSETYIYKQQGHMNDINIISFSPEGGQLASGAEDGRIKVFDISSSNCLITFTEHTAKITGLQYALNKSNLLISSSLDGTVRAYDLIKYKNFRIMTTPKQTQLICCSVDYSGEIVAAGSLDTYNIFIWSIKTGDLIDVLNGHTGPVSCLAFSHINDILVSGSWDNTVKMWELYTKKGISETYEHNSKITAIALSPNDKEVAVSTLNGELYTWDIDTGSIKNILDVSRDIWGGRLNEEKIAAKNAIRNKYLNSINYNLPGNLLICGGNSQYVLIYDMQYQILIKKFVLTHNRSLNGLLYKLNSKYDNNRTLLLQENNGFDSEDELEYNKKEKDILPGSKSALIPEVKINCIQFSNTNRSFAVGTTEGIYIYSLDKSLSFNKLSISIEVTLKDALDAFQNKNYIKGIIYSIYLKKIDLLDKYFDSIPISKVQLIVDKIPFGLVSPFLDYLCNKLEKDIHLQFVMIWINLLLKKNCRQLKNSKNKAVFLNLHRALMKMFKGIVNIVEDNIYTIKYLTEFEGNENNEEENDEKNDSKDEMKIDRDNDIQDIKDNEVNMED